MSTARVTSPWNSLLLTSLKFLPNFRGKLFAAFHVNELGSGACGIGF